MVEVDLLSLFGSGGAAGALYYLLHKEIDKLKDCISEKHLTNSKEIVRLKEKVGID